MVRVAGLVVEDSFRVVLSVRLSINLASHLSVAAGVLKACSLPLWLRQGGEEEQSQ